MAVGSLSPAEVAARLSVREYLKVCAYFDLNRAVKENCTQVARGNGPMGTSFMTVLPRVAPVTFEVLRVERTRGRVRISCRNAEGEPVLLVTENVVNIEDSAMYAVQNRSPQAAA